MANNIYALYQKFLSAHDFRACAAHGVVAVLGEAEA
jgi:hypothetical protein